MKLEKSLSFIVACLLLVWLGYVFWFAPAELPPYKFKIVGLFGSVLVGIMAFLLGGKASFWGRWGVGLGQGVGFKVGGAIAVSIGFFWLWHTPWSPVKSATIPVPVPFIDGEDVHLGDNVYPNKWGMSHNPLHQTIFQPEVAGLIYVDKENGQFRSGPDNPTVKGLEFLREYRSMLPFSDFSAYKHIVAYDGPEAEMPTVAKKLVLSGDTDSYVWLGPTLLYYSKEGKGNFYERLAAVAVLRSLDFTLPFREKGVQFRKSSIDKVEFVVECYSGGKRVGQNHNFALFINGHIYDLVTKKRTMREKEAITIELDENHFDYNNENVVGLFVLPWRESAPKDPVTHLGPCHFRDIGLIKAFFVLHALGT